MNHGGASQPPGSEGAPRPARDPHAAHAENLRAVYDSLRHAPRTVPTAKPGPPGPHRTRNTAVTGAAGVLLFLAGKLKFLGVLASVLKLQTLATMALSIGVYATQWGWQFAAGFVVLIFIHELGHAIVLHREGIPAGAPVFIPFVGAFIAMQGRPRDAAVEARVAIGGPILGSLGAWAALGAGLFVHSPLLVALGHVGAMLNLFNLIPVSPLDGGRIAGVFSRGFWIVGYAIGIAALVVLRSPILFLVMLAGVWTLVQRWRHPVPGYDAIAAGQRLAIGLGYAALAMALAATIMVVPVLRNVR